jgi:hypothetical protein
MRGGRVIGGSSGLERGFRGEEMRGREDSIKYYLEGDED